MNENSLKTSETTLRVLKLFLELISRPMSYEEMLKFVNEKSKTPVYTKEVLGKYINTLRAIGLNIGKYKGKYYLLNFLVQINLTDKETDIFNEIETSVLKYGTNNNLKTFYNIKQKLLKFFDAQSQNKVTKYVEQVLTTNIGLKIKQFEKLCDDGQIIKILYGKNELTVEPKQIIYFENMIYLECYNTNNYQTRKLNLEKITLLEQQPIKNRNLAMINSVTYEISGKLASRYKLKEGEILLAQHSEKLFIKVENEDYEFLAKRLIRYKNCCKIIGPVEFREYFKNYTDKILELYK